MKNKKYFLGWSNIKWGIIEIINLYSNKKSFFSKKRIESGIAFIILQWGMITYFVNKHDGMDMYDLIMWAGVEGVICGYTINQIQKEKKLNSESQESTEPEVTPEESTH